MTPKPTARELDRRVYEQEILSWLPPHVIDCHVHVGLKDHIGPISEARLKGNWAMEVGAEQSWERLRESRAMLLPGRRITSLVFGIPFQEVNLHANNSYVLDGLSDPSNDARALFVTRPDTQACAIADALSGGFAGIKPYPDFAPQTGVEPGIFDFLPHEHLRVLNEFAGILMLHIPRRGRLADPDNIREILEIAERYPAVRTIVAHIGRAFCLPTAEKGLPHFADVPAVYFDTAANLNADVFRFALEVVGPERLLYGSDLPITVMRGVREHVGEDYINYTDEPYSWNTNRKPPEEEAGYTFFLYEELRALIGAVRAAGLGSDAMEKIMHSNGAGLLGLGPGK